MVQTTGAEEMSALYALLRPIRDVRIGKLLGSDPSMLSTQVVFFWEQGLDRAPIRQVRVRSFGGSTEAERDPERGAKRGAGSGWLG